MVLNKKTQKSDYVDIRKLNDNFYILIRKKRYWNIKEIKFIKKYLNYKIFYPIPKNYIDISIFGYNCEYGYYEKSCPKYILFNFDSKNGERLSLRGITVVSNTGNDIHKNKKYFTIELIGNIAITNSIVRSMKRKNKIKVQSGKDMILFWREFGRRSYFDYCKLNAMEDVIGFYWKYGWRFTNNFKYFKKKEKRVSKHISKLNEVNIAYKNTKKEILLYDRDQILVKYFDRYMDNYYSDTKMTEYKLNNEDINYYLIKNTLHLQRFKMRFHGYPMYLNCK